MRLVWRLWIVLSFWCFARPALAQTPAPSAARPSKQLVSVGAMALSSSTQQGGQGPSGSTMLSQSEYVYAGPNVGAGLFFLYDLQGSTEKDSAYGPKVEASLDPFYLEIGYAFSVTRAYTDRTIAQQTGDGLFYGLGARFRIGASVNWFFQASYKIRTFNIKKQDGVELSEPIVQKDSYPLIGIGYQF